MQTAATATDRTTMTKNHQEPERDTPAKMADIAERCGVSRVTVSHVLRGTGRQSQATIDLVLRTAREMGYDAARSHTARRLASQKFGRSVVNKMIGMWMYLPFGSTEASLRQSNYTVMLWSGVLTAMAETDFEVSTCDSSRIEMKRALPESYRRGNIDGVLTISQAHQWTSSLKLLRGEPSFADRPIVGLVEHLDGASGVYPDNAAAGRAVVSHLLDLGHRFIAHFEYGPELDCETSVHGLRLRAYQEEYRSRGLGNDRLFQFDRWFAPEQPERRKSSLVEFLKQHPEITAIIAHDDQHAAEVHSALTAAGYRIPGDISLISYDDTDPILNERRENMLTSLRLPLIEIGREGTNLLIRRIMGEEQEDRDIVMPVELVVRKSTAPPKKSK
jgi:LacI family transcriptional regulator